MDNHRNVIIAIALSFLLLVGWTSAMDFFYPQPEQALVEDRADTPTEQASQAAATQHSRTGGLVDPTMRAQEVADVKTALASPDRIRIDAPRVAGSINLRGGMIDDIVLKGYDETTKKDSEPVRIFSPNGTPAQQFAQFGWVGSNLKVPGPQTLWEADGEVLTAEKPVTLTHDNGEGLTFSIRYSIDDKYMVTAEQKVANAGGNPAVVQPFGLVNRTSRTASEDLWIAHSGPVGVFGDSADYDIDYGDLDESQRVSPEGRTSWAGFTDIYWLAALVPQDDAAPETTFRAMGNETYRADMIFLCPGDDWATLYPDIYAEAGIRRCKLQMLRLAAPGWRMSRPVMSDLGLARYEGYSALPETTALTQELRAGQGALFDAGIHLIAVQSADGSLVVGDSHDYGEAPDPFHHAAIDALMLEE